MGLLLLRLVAGLNAISQGAAYWFTPGTPTFKAWLAGLGAIAIGVSLLIGFLTPIASSLLALGSTGVVLSLLPLVPQGLLGAKPLTIQLIGLALAVLLLGPGEFSLDARLFGRREIIIPETPRLPKS